MKFGTLLFLILTGCFFFPQITQAQTIKQDAPQIRVANDQKGADLGAKINVADAACGTNIGCEIWVFDGGSQSANTISTQIIVGSYHTLRFFSGTFYCNVFSQIGVFLMKDNSNLIGSGWNTIIVENNDPDVQTYNPKLGYGTNRTAFYRIVGMFNDSFICNRDSNARTCRSSNVHVRDIQFKGVRSNQHDGGVAGAVSFSHCYGCSLRFCWFNEISGYAAVFGGTPAGTTDDDPTTYGTNIPANYAKDNWFTDNLMTNLQSQNLAIISAENLHVERNIFREPGKRPYNITNITNTKGQPIVVTVAEPHHFYGGVGIRLQNVKATGGASPISSETEYHVRKLSPTTFSLISTTINSGTPANPVYITPVNGTGTGSYTTVGAVTDLRGIFLVGIDVEPNGSPFERVNNVSISDNIFDFRKCNGVSTTAIAYQITAAGIANEGAEISKNTIWGNETGTGQLSIGIQISYPFTTGVTVADNFIKKAGNVGLFLSGSRIAVSNNTLVDSGGGGSGSLQTSSLTNSNVVNTNIRNPTYGVSSIRERGVSNNNYWANNFVNLHYHDAGSTITNSIYKDNYWAGGIPSQTGFYETPGSNNNIFDGNITRPKLISNESFGLTIVGAGSKIISHKFTDGRMFIPNLNGIKTPFTNPN